MIFLVFLPILLFSLILIFLISGKNRSVKSGFTPSRISVLITFRNDVVELSLLINRLIKILPSDGSVEVILVNDQSDQNLAKINALLAADRRFRMINPLAEHRGKKMATRYAMNLDLHAWVLFLDADTIPGEALIKLDFSISAATKMALIPLRPEPGKSLIRKFFDLDFLSLHWSGLRSANMGRPLLSNAACLLVNREAYLNTVSDRPDWKRASGDDVFLMFAIANRYGRKSVSTLNICGEHTTVSFKNSFNELWSQRLRWVSKTPAIANPWFRIVSTTVLMSSISLIAAVALFAFQYNMGTFFYMAVAAIALEAIALMLACKNHGRNDLMAYVIPAIFIYPFYLGALSISSLIYRKEW